MQTKAGSIICMIIISSILLIPICETNAGQEGLSVKVTLSRNYASRGDLVDVTVSLLGYSSNNIGVVEACIPIDTSLFSVVEESVRNLLETKEGSPIITLGYRKGSCEVYYSYVDVLNAVEKGGSIFSFQVEVVGENVNVMKEFGFSSVLLADKDFKNLDFRTDTSSIYITNYSFNKENRYLSKIHKKTKVKDFKDSLSALNVEIYDKNNNHANNDAFVGTGMKARFELNGELNEFLIGVSGDANGDGEINITDLIVVRAHILNKKKLEGIYFYAADVNGNGEINITDYVGINADILNKRFIVPN